MNGEVDVQLSLFGLLLLTQPLHSSEQQTRANLEFSSNFAIALGVTPRGPKYTQQPWKGGDQPQASEMGHCLGQTQFLYCCK